MLRYYKQYHGEDDIKEITYEEALNTLLTTWKDNDMTRDMLTIPNRIWCRYSYITIEDYKNETDRTVLMAGMENILPMGIDYDNNGNHIQQMGSLNTPHLLQICSIHYTQILSLKMDFFLENTLIMYYN